MPNFTEHLPCRALPHAVTWSLHLLRSCSTRRRRSGPWTRTTSTSSAPARRRATQPPSPPTLPARTLPRPYYSATPSWTDAYCRRLGLVHARAACSMKCSVSMPFSFSLLIDAYSREGRPTPLWRPSTRVQGAAGVKAGRFTCVWRLREGKAVLVSSPGLCSSPSRSPACTPGAAARQVFDADVSLGACNLAGR
jgi:hypothetical protein